MKRIIFFGVLLISGFLQAQISFENGYIVTNSGDRENVLIKNIDWIGSPDFITYKKDVSSPEVTGNPSNIKEFQVSGYPRYISASVDLDTSPSELSFLSYKYEPVLKRETVFLKELANGDKKLYSYRSKNISNYFYTDSAEETPTLLVYKKYHPDGKAGLVAYNETYTKQLNTIFQNDSTAKKMVSRTKYTESDLKKLFTAANGNSETISGSDSTSLTKPISKSKFNLAVRPGINFYSALDINGFYGAAAFPSRTGYRIGLEAELILPFNKNKWSVIFEPNFNMYSNETQTSFTKFNQYLVSLDNYSFVNLPLGIRHHMYINSKLKAFINAQSNVFSFKTSKAKAITTQYNELVFENYELDQSRTFTSFTIGVGTAYNNKFSAEIRYSTSDNIITKSLSRSAAMSFTSIIIGYNIF